MTMTVQQNIQNALDVLEATDRLLSGGKKKPAKKRGTTKKKAKKVVKKKATKKLPKGGKPKPAPKQEAKRPAQKKGKKDVSNKKQKRAGVKASTKLTASQKAAVRRWRKLPAEQKELLRAFGPSRNLRALNRVIQKGIISAEEVVGAFQEALRAKRVSPRLAEAMADAIREVLGVGEVIDMDIAAKVSAAKKLPNIKAGDIVRLTADFLRSTGQAVGGEGHKKWKVKKVKKVATSSFAVVDEISPYYESGMFTPDELKADPDLKFRRINLFNLQKVGK